jgi:sucrose-6-phosphate hydrolase SacC (GH32 family)
MDWVYRGSVYDWPDQSMTYGTSWELPILLPLTNKAGTITKYFFSISPAPASMADNKVYYFVGDFDRETGKFIPDERFIDGPALLDYGSNVFTGPSALVDPVSGDVYLFSIMQDQRGGRRSRVGPLCRAAPEDMAKRRGDRCDDESRRYAA